MSIIDNPCSLFVTHDIVLGKPIDAVIINGAVIATEY